MGIYGDLLKLNEKQPAAQPAKQAPKRSAVSEPSNKPSKTQTPHEETNHATTPPRHHATTTPRNHGSTASRYDDTVIRVVRAAVKLFGKEAATHRFTLEEKKAIADIVYTYKQQETKTSENEITRIGVNFILQDYQENGERSVLHRVIKALNS